MGSESAERDQRRLGWMLAAAGMLLVSTDSLFVRVARLNGWDMAFLVAVFSLPVFLTGWMTERRRRPVTGRDVLPLLGLGALGAISHVAFISAVTRTDVSNVVAIVAAVPVVAAVGGRVLLGERVSARVWGAIAVTAGGIGLIVARSVGRPDAAGDLLAVLAVVSFAGLVVLWRRYEQLSRNLALMCSSSLIVMATAPVVEPLTHDVRAYLSAAGMGLLFSPAGRLALGSAPRFAPAAEVALFAPVETVAATAWAWLAFGEVPLLTTTLGAVIIVAGVLWGTAGGLTRSGAT